METKSPFRALGSFVIMVPYDLPGVAENNTSTEDSKESANPDGRAKNPWGLVLEVGPDVKTVNQGDVVMHFYAEDLDYQKVKYLLARESDLFVALKI